MKKFLSLFFFIIFFSLGLFLNNSNASDYIEIQEIYNNLNYAELDGIYTISTIINNNFGLDVTGRSELEGTNIELWTLSEKNHQRFYLKNLGDGIYTIQAVHSGKYVTLNYNNYTNEANVEQSSFNNTDRQKWMIKKDISGYYYIISKYNGLYLTVDGAVKNGTNINLKAGNSNNSQKFMFNEIETKKGKRTIENGVYSIRSKINKNYALDINFASLYDNANLELYEYKNKDNNQKFKITYLDDGTYSIEVLCSAKLLTVYESLIKNGVNVSQFANKNLDSQKWIIELNGDGYYNIISKCNSMYLNVDGIIKNGTNINTKYYNKSDNQEFEFIREKDNIIKGNKTIDDGKYEIQSNINNNYVLDITSTSLLEGANVELYYKNDKNNQKFQVEYIGEGYYKIETLHSNKALTVTRSITQEGANVEQRDYVGSDSQKWVIQEADNNYFFIISKCNGLALSLDSSKSVNGVNIVTKKLQYNNAQKFKFNKTEYFKYIEENKKYTIKSGINTQMVLDVTGRSLQDGTNIEIWTNKKMDHQKFIFEYVGDGAYIIRIVHSNKVLTVKEQNLGDNIYNVEQREFKGLENQKWQIIKVGGFYFIRSNYNNLYLNIDGGMTLLGANVNVSNIEKGIDKKKFIIETEDCLGIDISQYNGNINWKSVKQDNIDFAIIRIGYRGYGSGKIVFDSKFKENTISATSNNIKVGAYFVTQAINYQEGAEEANEVLKKIKEYNINITYPIVVDIEWAGGDEGHNGRADYISTASRTEAAKGFCNTIKNAGFKPMIYANKYWLNSYLDMSKLNNFDVWLAHYVVGAPSKKSDYKGTYLMWQYTSKGKINGISGDVDLNILYK